MFRSLRKTASIGAGAAVLCLGFLAGPIEAADAYPSTTIKLVVGFPPGGPTDIIGRVIGRLLAKELNQNVIVENNGGAGGMIAASNVSRANPDGYTLLVAVESSNTRAKALYSSVRYDQQKGFTYIRKVAKQRNLLVVNPKLPVSTVPELVAYLKAHPGEVNFGGTFGATSHVGGTLFDMAYDTKMTFINYSGGNQPIVDCMSGILQVGFFTEATIGQQVKAGSLKALAVTSADRSPAFPDLPTIEQAAGKLLDISPWFGVAGPPNLPADVVAKVGAALDKASSDPEFLKQLETIGATLITGSTVSTFTAEVGQEEAYWNKWAKDIGAPLQK
ncbi:tripartite tricarboxylate transporter substrate binding protein (plasmid) [Bradyrhizobium sp. 4]|uniref:Bug family tripartite tricarboxylate transporter substrate binding protein n=1 Tax=unclassified Bradyrhizobium TaxID=2631580 RepID=UPI001FF70F63|nr:MULTISPECIES: tripartite tricarboxylate transporter substrate binding protein [unclassified Bradyrhizobium]MCK1401332.1 tripartite tricarboxylate transporter substrate binding protein [Bradyrhizobium sp. 39]MCK1752310.1 tripartite tricarboxylate transporter substrate binding protein [Bradyrhizobium sp. 135]UPJ39124.1 tripartite tricarboxylate transporter substrate binding protein [Bradyrhizobium sp. 4]